jgi:hypothetical protein
MALMGLGVAFVLAFAQRFYSDHVAVPIEKEVRL